MGKLIFGLCLLGALAACDKAPQAAVAGVSQTANAQQRISENSPTDAVDKYGFPELLRRAGDGDPRAQHFVAVAYLMGTTVPKNFDEAARWARRAANQGSSASQFLMGLIRRDDALADNDLLALQPKITLAYMWFNLAASQGHEKAKQERDSLEGNADPRWIARAQKLSAEWRPCASAACADYEPTP
jgi:TPR repeat protein